MEITADPFWQVCCCCFSGRLLKRKCCQPAKVVFKCDIDGFVVRMRVASHPSFLYAFMDDAARSYVCNDLLFSTRHLGLRHANFFSFWNQAQTKIRSGPPVSSVSELQIFFDCRIIS
jgi:hypothetical protein